MLNHFCLRCAKKCSEKGYCLSEQVPMLAYRFEIWAGRLITYPALLLSTIVAWQVCGVSFWASLLLLINWVILRKFAGGYHARTHLGCFLMSLGVYLLGIVLIGPFFTRHVVCMIVALLISGIAIFSFGPFIHPNIYYEMGTDRHMKIALRVVFALLVLQLVVMYSVSQNDSLAAYAACGMLFSAIFMLAGIINERIGSYERQHRTESNKADCFESCKGDD